jgi:hypothetical protein
MLSETVGVDSSTCAHLHAGGRRRACRRARRRGARVQPQASEPGGGGVRRGGERETPWVVVVEVGVVCGRSGPRRVGIRNNSKQFENNSKTIRNNSKQFETHLRRARSPAAGASTRCRSRWPAPRACPPAQYNSLGVSNMVLKMHYAFQ